MNKWLAFCKYIASFLKKRWRISDYPLRIIRPDHTGPGTPKYFIQIINWWRAAGIGETRREALLELQYFLIRFEVEKGYLPRPGTRVAVELSPTDQLKKHPDVAREFITKILGFTEADPLFISDESKLDDFFDASAEPQPEKKIQEIFGIDLSDIKDRKLVNIFERIEKRRRSQSY